MRVSSLCGHLLELLIGVHRVVKTQAPSTAPSRFIVTFHPQEQFSADLFRGFLVEQNISVTIIHDYVSLAPNILYGVGVLTDNFEDIKKLEASDQVKRVSQVHKLSSIQPAGRTPVSSSLKLSEPYPPHVQTEVSKLHQAGYYGEGVKIAVLDGAADCSHPALGGGYGKGFKIAFGRDLVGDNYDGLRNPEPDDNPCGTCGDHSSHVMGIIGASDVGQGFTGVAPNATLGLYRIFGCGKEPFVTDDVLIEALLHAYKDGADIISVSLGFPGGWGEGNLVSETVNKLVEEGVTIVVSTGNEGIEGIFYAANPASAKNAISVGSVESTGHLSASLLTSTGREMSYITAQSFANFTGVFPVYATANLTNTTADACSPLSPSTPLLEQYVVLIRRGGCTIDRKIKNAQAKGATKVLVYMNTTATLTIPNSPSGVRAAMLSQEDGLYLFESAKNDPTGFTLSFPQTDMKFLPAPAGGLMSNFSSYGPSFDSLSPQPALCGIGGSVVSTVPSINGSYSSLSGTSMAAPQIAGIAALVMGVRGKQVRGLTMRTRITTTSRPVQTYSRTKVLETVVHQGAGLVDAYCAAFSNTTLSTSALALNDTDHFNGTQSFTLTNEGSDTVNYVLSHSPAMTVYYFAPSEQYGRPNPTPLQDMNFATLKLPSESITVRPGESFSVTVTIAPPDIDSKLLGVFSGHITLEADSPCESHSLPYYGTVGSLKDLKPLDRGLTPEPAFSYNLPHLNFGRSNLSRINYTSRGELIWNQSLRNTTYLVYRTNFGCPSIRVYVIPAAESSFLRRHWPRGNRQWKSSTIIGNSRPRNWPSLKIFKDRLYKRYVSRRKCPMTSQNYPYESCGGVTLMGEIPNSEQKLLPRSSRSQIWQVPFDGNLSVAQGQPLQQLPKGKYKVLIRALRMYNDPEEWDSYESWESPVLVIGD